MFEIQQINNEEIWELSILLESAKAYSICANYQVMWINDIPDDWCIRVAIESKTLPQKAVIGTELQVDEASKTLFEFTEAYWNYSLWKYYKLSNWKYLYIDMPLTALEDLVRPHEYVELKILK